MSINYEDPELIRLANLCFGTNSSITLDEQASVNTAVQNLIVFLRTSLSPESISSNAYRIREQLSDRYVRLDCVLRDIRQSHKVPLDPKDFFEQLRLLEKEYSEVEYRDGILSVAIGEITITDHSRDNRQVRMGKYKILFNLQTATGESNPIRDIRTSWQVQLAAPGIKRPEYYIHPHCAAASFETSHLCLGEGHTMFNHLVECGEIVEAVAIMKAVLHSYDRRGAYVSLDRWGAGICYMCNAPIPEEAGVPTKTCKYCNVSSCPTCMTTRSCSVCGEYVCTHHKKKRSLHRCPICKKLFCGEHISSVRKHPCVKKHSELCRELANRFPDVEEVRAIMAASGIHTVDTTETEKTQEEQNVVTITPYERVLYEQTSAERISINYNTGYNMGLIDGDIRPAVARPVESPEQTGWLE